MPDNPKIWALGGESLSAPEDTMPAYWGAVAAGADGLVIGVQMTADKRVVCCSQQTLQATCGDKRKVSAVKFAELTQLDAAARFDSLQLNKANQPLAKKGKGKPWKSRKGNRVPVYHPSLEEVCLKFGRRVGLMFHLLPASSSSAARTALVKHVTTVLRQFGLDRSSLLAGDAATLRVAKRLSQGELVLVAGERQGVEAAASEAVDVGASNLWIHAEEFGEDIADTSEGVNIFVGSKKMPFALTPSEHLRLMRTGCVGGFVCRAVHETMDYLQPRCLVFEEKFASLDEKTWHLGYSKPNQDTEIKVKKGLHIDISEAGEYSGAAALLNFSLHGAFDVQVDFTVANPNQGTTFELAAIQVDPGYHHPNNKDLTRKNVNLTFDVHGAPPYASSERDENDGFRLGWNNGPAVTDFAADPISLLRQLYGTALQRIAPDMLDGDPPGYVGKVAQSSNIYNKYSRDVGDAKEANASGQLRLVRCGSAFSAYYTDHNNSGWVLCGTAQVPTLCEDVFIRLGAKHWPKGGRTPPWNKVTFKNFRVYQRQL